MKPAPMIRTGLILAGLLGLADLATIAAGDGEFPPVEVAVVAAVLGLITLVAAVLGWRGSRPAVILVVVTRALSALGAVPAFFADGVPAVAQIAASVLIALTVVSITLLAPALRRPTMVTP